MKKYNRVMLGSGSMYATECRNQGYIGVDFDIARDLSDLTKLEWKDFNSEIVHSVQEMYPDKSRTSAGMTAGFLFTICNGLSIGDTVISPDGKGNYYRNR